MLVVEPRPRRNWHRYSSEQMSGPLPPSRGRRRRAARSAGRAAARGSRPRPRGAGHRDRPDRRSARRPGGSCGVERRARLIMERDGRAVRHPIDALHGPLRRVCARPADGTGARLLHGQRHPIEPEADRPRGRWNLEGHDSASSMSDFVAPYRAPTAWPTRSTLQRLYGSRPTGYAVSSASRDGPCCSRCAIAVAASGSHPPSSAPARRLIASTTVPLRSARYNVGGLEVTRTERDGKVHQPVSIKAPTESLQSRARAHNHIFISLDVTEERSRLRRCRCVCRDLRSRQVR